MDSVAEHDIEVRDQDQTVVPTTLEIEENHHLVRLTREPKGSNLSVQFRDLCGIGGSTHATVNLTARTALPTTAGTAGLRSSVATYSGVARCLPANVFMVVDVTLSPELQAYKELARWDVTYKGKTTRVGYGDLQSTGNVGHVLLEDVCKPDTDTVGGLVTIAVHVAGAVADPSPLQLTVSARCPDFQSPKAPPACPNTDANAPTNSEPPADAGTDANDGLAGPNGDASRTTDAVGVPRMTSDAVTSGAHPSGGACQMIGHGVAPSSSIGLIALALGALAVRRPRRSSRRR